MNSTNFTNSCVTAKMTQYGQAALDRTTTLTGSVTPMDPIAERVLLAERAIAEQYPDGDVAAVGERLLSDMVAIFQELHHRDELDQHVDMLSRSNEHAASLGEALESGDQSAVLSALASVIEDFRLVSSSDE